jgi:hypothetical protein
MTSRVESLSHIIVDYHHASTGPTITLDIQSSEAMKALSGLFRQLAVSAHHEVHLADSPFIVFTDAIKDILLRRTEKFYEPSRTLRLIQTSGPAIFEWTRHDEGWLECADVVDGLTEPCGHQYLNRGLRDEAEIVASFKELERGEHDRR